MNMPDKPAVSIDRIEGDRAILDFAGELIEIPAAALPEGAAEGSRLTLDLAPAEETDRAEDAAAAQQTRLKTKRTSLDDFEF
ncbi:MAG: DUF3006 domain-containing protein [Myxococcota bacterium]|nr:DUF3006 domain-containing protein [Myxococcota bacterium]